MSVYSIALSGLNAQSTALGVRAQNIANAGVTGKVSPVGNDRRAYAPVDAVNISAPGGGVSTEVVPVDPATVNYYDPDSPDSNEEGLVAAPNVSLDEEVVGILTAKNAYIANAKVINVQREMDDALMDILT